MTVNLSSSCSVSGLRCVALSPRLSDSASGASDHSNSSNSSSSNYSSHSSSSSLSPIVLTVASLYKPEAKPACHGRSAIAWAGALIPALTGDAGNVRAAPMDASTRPVGIHPPGHTLSLESRTLGENNSTIYRYTASYRIKQQYLRVRWGRPITWAP